MFSEMRTERKSMGPTEHQSFGSPTSTVLLAEADDEMRRQLTRSLSEVGYCVTVCNSAMDLHNRMRTSRRGRGSGRCALIVVGIRLPDLTGLELVQSLNGRLGVPPIILITAFSDEAARGRAKRAGAVEVFEEPFKIADLLGVVRQITRVQDVLQPLQ